jgi:hypothetical protein
MTFRPYPTHSGFLFLGLALILTAVAFGLTNLLLQQREPPEIFMALIALLVVLAVIGLAVHWTVIVFRLDYHLNRNGLTIRWGLGQQLIPFNGIKTIISGKEIAAPNRLRVANIAGLRFGWGQLPEYGPLKFRATAPLTESLLVVTDRQTYVISPNQPNAFLKAWQTRQTLGPTQQWSEGMRRYWPFNIALLLDPLTWQLLGLAAALALALLGYICLNYSDFPRSLPIHFNDLGQADRIADKMTLFTFPAVAGLAWALNLILGALFYRQEKVAAYLLWGSAIVMQLCLWMAVLTITA